MAELRRTVPIAQASDVAIILGRVCENCLWGQYKNPVVYDCHRKSPPWIETHNKGFCGEFEQRPKELVTNA
jgi:hypothetical protein